MRRRGFIKQFGWLGAGAISPFWWDSGLASGMARQDGKEQQSDIVILGGGLGGCAAAMAACRLGASVILTEPTDWLGGQVSQQAVPPDEHQWIEEAGRPASYARYRRRVREYYRTNYHLTPEAREADYLNPGNGAVSRICHEPAVSVKFLSSCSCHRSLKAN